MKKTTFSTLCVLTLIGYMIALVVVTNSLTDTFFSSGLTSVITKQTVDPKPEAKKDEPAKWAIYLKKPIAEAIQTSPFTHIIVGPKVDDLTKIKSNKNLYAFVSAGEAEKHNNYWKSEWNKKKPSWIGQENAWWRGNYEVKQLLNDQWVSIIKTQIDYVISKGYQGVVLGGLSIYDSNDSAKVIKQKVDLVVMLSKYAKQKNRKFVVLLQDAEHLVIDPSVLNAIDGIVKHDLVFSWMANGTTGPKNSAAEVAHSLELLRKVQQEGKTVIVIEYVSGPDWAKAKDIISKEKFYGYSAPRQLNALRMSQ